MSKEDILTKAKSFRLTVKLVDKLKEMKKAKQIDQVGEFVEESIWDKIKNVDFRDEMKGIVSDLISKSMKEFSPIDEMDSHLKAMGDVVENIKRDTFDISTVAALRYERAKFSVLYLIATDQKLDADPLTFEVLSELVRSGFVIRQDSGEYEISFVPQT